MFYHFFAVLFYFAAFVLEAATTAANGGAHVQTLPNTTEGVLCITYPRGNVFTVLSSTEYNINVAATVSATDVGCMGSRLVKVKLGLKSETKSERNTSLDSFAYTK